MGACILAIDDKTVLLGIYRIFDAKLTNRVTGRFIRLFIDSSAGEAECVRNPRSFQPAYTEVQA